MHGLGNKLITNREVLAALFWGWGAFWRHWAAVWERSCFLEYFMEGTKSLRCFMWQAEDGIQSQQTAEGLSRESLCLCRNAAQKNLNFLWVVLKNPWIPESKIINPTLELEHHLVPEQGTECHVQSFPEGWARGYIWADWFFMELLDPEVFTFPCCVSGALRLWDISHWHVACRRGWTQGLLGCAACDWNKSHFSPSELSKIPRAGRLSENSNFRGKKR